MGISTKTCKKCGTELLPGADFCDHCGIAVTLKGKYNQNKKILALILFILPIIFFMYIGWSLFINYGSSYYMHNGDAAFSKKDFENALYYYNESVRLDPKNKEALYYKGLSQLWLGKKAGLFNEKNKKMNYLNESLRSLLEASKLPGGNDENYNFLIYWQMYDVSNMVGNGTEAKKWKDLLNHSWG